MQIKKIILTPKSWLITPLESDTVLSYIFAFNYEKLKDILDDFIKWEVLPFNITNAFQTWFLPKPIYFSEIIKINDCSLEEDLRNEKNRKKLKKLNKFPLNKSFFELLFNWKVEELNNKLVDLNLDEDKINISEAKNSIPRFHKWETTPYHIDDIEYISSSYTIYVKIYDERKFQLFFDCLKNNFETIWFWKWKSKWYWHFKNVELLGLDEEEKEVFDYFEELKKEKWYNIILNNFKPSNNDLENINIDKSYYVLNTKHTKSLSEFNKNIFKWQMNFFSPWSLLISDKIIIWDYYKSGNSYNFWYIF